MYIVYVYIYIYMYRERVYAKQQNNKTHYQLEPWMYCTVYIRVALAVPCTSMMSIFVQDL